MKFLIAHLILKPLILRNYRLRAAGKLPDEWYWADSLAYHWGYALERKLGKQVLRKRYEESWLA